MRAILFLLLCYAISIEGIAYTWSCTSYEWNTYSWTNPTCWDTGVSPQGTISDDVIINSPYSMIVIELSDAVQGLTLNISGNLILRVSSFNSVAFTRINVKSSATLEVYGAIATDALGLEGGVLSLIASNMSVPILEATGSSSISVYAARTLSVAQLLWNSTSVVSISSLEGPGAQFVVNYGVISSPVINLYGVYFKSMYNLVLNDVTSIQITDHAVFSNDGMMSIRSSGVLSASGNYGNWDLPRPSFWNLGTLELFGLQSFETNSDLRFDNNGTINFGNTNTITIRSIESYNQGTFATSGAPLLFNGGAIYLNSPATFIGVSSLNITGGSVYSSANSVSCPVHVHSGTRFVLQESFSLNPSLCINVVGELVFNTSTTVPCVKLMDGRIEVMENNLGYISTVFNWEGHNSRIYSYYYYFNEYYEQPKLVLLPGCRSIITASSLSARTNGGASQLSQVEFRNEGELLFMLSAPYFNMDVCNLTNSGQINMTTSAPWIFDGQYSYFNNTGHMHIAPLNGQDIRLEVALSNDGTIYVQGGQLIFGSFSIGSSHQGSFNGSSEVRLDFIGQPHFLDYGATVYRHLKIVFHAAMFIYTDRFYPSNFTFYDNVNFYSMYATNETITLDSWSQRLYFYDRAQLSLVRVAAGEIFFNHSSCVDILEINPSSALTISIYQDAILSIVTQFIVYGPLQHTPIIRVVGEYERFGSVTLLPTCTAYIQGQLSFYSIELNNFGNMTILGVVGDLSAWLVNHPGGTLVFGQTSFNMISILNYGELNIYLPLTVLNINTNGTLRVGNTLQANYITQLGGETFFLTSARVSASMFMLGNGELHGSGQLSGQLHHEGGILKLGGNTVTTFNVESYNQFPSAILEFDAPGDILQAQGLCALNGVVHINNPQIPASYYALVCYGGISQYPTGACGNGCTLNASLDNNQMTFNTDSFSTNCPECINGYCSSSGCICLTGYTGVACENLAQPMIDCFWGTAVSPYSCNCPPSYHGAQCNITFDLCPVKSSGPQSITTGLTTGMFTTTMSSVSDGTGQASSTGTTSSVTTAGQTGVTTSTSGAAATTTNSVTTQQTGSGDNEPLGSDNIGGSGSNAGAIAGGIVGALVLLALLALLALLIMRRRKRKQQNTVEAPVLITKSVDDHYSELTPNANEEKLKKEQADREERQKEAEKQRRVAEKQQKEAEKQRKETEKLEKKEKERKEKEKKAKTLKKNKTEVPLQPVMRALKDIQIQEKLGGGNFGEVYKGVWNGVTPVALKRLKNEEHLKEFAKEAGILQSLSYVNVVQFFGIHHSATGEQYIVTEYLNKGSLSQLLQSPEKKVIDSDDLLAMARDAAAGMLYLHNQSIIHCDLALRNLLVASGTSAKYIVKVGDFGLSKIMQDSEYYSSSAKQIPIKWSALEVIHYGKYSFASDVWSMGVVLWELWSFGKLPYAGLSNLETIDKIESGYRLPQPLNCPIEVYQLTMRCWREDPSERPTMKEVLSTLDSLYQRTKQPVVQDTPKVVEEPTPELYN